MENIRTYPIKAVSVKTGLSIHVIRVWEKRYQAVTPKRTDTNRRVYTDQDIEKLLLLKQATQEGHNIGSVASLNSAALKELLSEISVTASVQSENKINDLDVSPVVDECLLAIRNFDDHAFEKILLNASYQLSQPELLHKLIIPLIHKIGELWHCGEIRIMHEHMATAVLRSFISNMRNNYRIEENAPSIIVTTPMGQNHEMGALILSLVAASDGWKVTYLGPDLPADEIAAAVSEKKARAVLLSIVYPADDQYLKIDLQKLGTLLPKNVMIIVGGRMAKNYYWELQKINAHNVESLADFRKISNDLKKQ
jgi:MerR family transcriptional regulator, light-induced transcriptional regulator